MIKQNHAATNSENEVIISINSASGLINKDNKIIEQQLISYLVIKE